MVACMNAESEEALKEENASLKLRVEELDAGNLSKVKILKS